MQILNARMSIPLHEFIHFIQSLIRDRQKGKKFFRVQVAALSTIRGLTNDIKVVDNFTVLDSMSSEEEEVYSSEEEKGPKRARMVSSVVSSSSACYLGAESSSEEEEEDVVVLLD